VEIIAATTEAHVRLAAPLFDQYRVFYKQTPDLKASYRFLRERWIARESVLFLALDERGEAVGFVHLYPFFLSMRRFWVLNDLYVTPPARRKGTARALIRRAARHASETGSAGLTLSTAMRRLFMSRKATCETLGFSATTGFSKNEYGA
jgi:GNAT superfamily N-acetyltransferase